MFLASQKCISQNRNSDSCGPGEISLKYMATGDFPVETIDLPFGFVAIAATSWEEENFETEWKPLKTKWFIKKDKYKEMKRIN